VKNFNIENVKVLHLEPTTICNASCFQCSRENPKLFNELLHNNEIKINQCKEIFKPSFIKQLNKMFMCGNFGDPAAAKDVLEIFKYFRKHNPNIVLGMNTNGSLRSTKFWSELGEIFSNIYDYVIFAIDGLEDTNHIYRKNTNFNKILNNARAFINAGGSAHWEMLVFNYNEHQVDEAFNIANNNKFSWFRIKVSKRNFNTTNIVQPPSKYKLPATPTTNIICQALEEESVFVSANGQFHPCCWFGNYMYNNDNYYKKLVNSEKWNKLLESFNNNPHEICYNNCGINGLNTTVFESQWVKEFELSKYIKNKV